MQTPNIKPTKTFAAFSASRYPLPVKVLESILVSGNIYVKRIVYIKHIHTQSIYIYIKHTVRFQEISTARISWNRFKLTLSIVLCSNFLSTPV